MPSKMTESDVERLFLDILSDLGYSVKFGPDISPGGLYKEREYSEVVLAGRLRERLRIINPSLPEDAIEEAFRKIVKQESQDMIFNNRSFHNLLVNGIDVQYKQADGSIKHDKAFMMDFHSTDNNEFLAVNQLTVIEEHERRPDIILYINGIPIVIIEMKNPADENATVWSAFDQVRTYMADIKSIFRFNEIIMLSDGIETRSGTMTSPKERFALWKTVDYEKPGNMNSLETTIRGMLSKHTLIDLVRNFIVFETEHSNGSIKVSKKMAAYQQYNATNKAVKGTIDAMDSSDRRAGIVWHTQGSGKSLTMVFYSGKLVLEPKMQNPTIIVLTDRNDLDDQLFQTFTRCQDLLRQEPKQADTRRSLKEMIGVASGGIIFTTIQKFLPEEGSDFPLLSERKNIVVIADEAHRSQYGFSAEISMDDADVRYGYAKYLRDAVPNATFIGFTGTPIEKEDRSTTQVFGKYVDVYDVQQAVEDGSTVRIYYESRLAKIDLKPEERPHIDEEFEEITEGEEISAKERLKTKWARVETVVGSPNRVRTIARDIVDHWEKRSSVLEGKAMIVTMSRRIAIELHDEIINLRPGWYDRDDEKGTLKVIMTGSAADGPEWQEHIRNKERRRRLGERMKDPNDPLKIVIVRDMWLTGFDAPSLHTMYIDKPMKGHTLMQAIARVNRVFRDKPGGLVVDYLGLAFELKKALSEYTEGDRRETGIPLEQAIAVMNEKFEIVRDMFHGFDYGEFFRADTKERLMTIEKAMDHILGLDDGKNRYIKYVTELTRAFALVVPNPAALAIRDDVGFYQAVRSALIKNTEARNVGDASSETAIQQILSKALVSDRVIDIFAAAGLNKPDISILSDEFLVEVRDMPQRNLAFEMLKKLLNDEIRIRMRKNIVQQRSFLQLLENAIKAYTNKSIEAAQVIQELIELAKKVREEQNRGKDLGLNDDELAFYDALADNESAKQVLGDATLKTIARELVEKVRNNITIDWTQRESVQAKLRLMVKKILKKYGYPPDKQEKATLTVLEQAKLLGYEWVP
ncbi:MAG: type I restriction endonuclease subunit R [Nitrososphaerota archaeon]|nr:type I restriction endonuclease subunit R [Nitrososphaerota archaeon]MDG7051492.1 type I restriction endonuclease subunit R [Nitrososphaerota archaeon]